MVGNPVKPSRLAESSLDKYLWGFPKPCNEDDRIRIHFAKLTTGREIASRRRPKQFQKIKQSTRLTFGFFRTFRLFDFSTFRLFGFPSFSVCARAQTLATTGVGAPRLWGLLAYNPLTRSFGHGSDCFFRAEAWYLDAPNTGAGVRWTNGAPYQHPASAFPITALE